jgi:hypothetical protein
VPTEEVVCQSIGCCTRAGVPFTAEPPSRTAIWNEIAYYRIPVARLVAL